MSWAVLDTFYKLLDSVLTTLSGRHIVPNLQGTKELLLTEVRDLPEITKLSNKCLNLYSCWPSLPRTGGGHPLGLGYFIQCKKTCT